MSAKKWFPLLFLALPISFCGVLSVANPVQAQTGYLFNKCHKCKRAACCCPATAPQPATGQTQDVCPPGQQLPVPAQGDFVPGQPDPSTAGETDPSASQPDSQQPDGLTTPDFSPDLAAAGQPSFDLSRGTGGGAAEAIGGNESTIGDFFGGGGVVQGPSWNGGITVPIAAGDRYYKLTDHTSPLPQDRVFFNYHVFGNAVSDANGNTFDLTRYTFGLERTFLDSNMSFEVRIPFAYGLDATQIEQSNGGSRLAGTEFGNVSLVTKAILARNCCTAISTGFATTLPTAEDALLVANDSSSVVTIENDTYKLQPFLAYHRTPNRRNWFTAYSAIDFTANGNPVISSGGPPEVYNDQNLLFLTLSTGRWFYLNSDCCVTRRCGSLRNCGRSRHLSGIAGIVELHYTTTLNDTDTVVAGSSFGDVITNPNNRSDILNLTSGLRFKFGDRSFVTLAGAAPLRTDENRSFDAEFSLLCSRLY